MGPDSVLNKAQVLPEKNIKNLGAALHLHAGNAELVALIQCTDDASCTALRERVMQGRMMLSANLALRLAGASELLDNVKAEVKDGILRVSTHDTEAHVASLLSNARSLAGGAGALLPH
jgi:hypothetical protein